MDSCWFSSAVQYKIFFTNTAILAYSESLFGRMHEFMAPSNKMFPDNLLEIMLSHVCELLLVCVSKWSEYSRREIIRETLRSQMYTWLYTEAIFIIAEIYFLNYCHFLSLTSTTAHKQLDSLYFISTYQHFPCS